MQDHMPRANEVCVVSNLYPFMIASSYKESPLSVVFLLLRRVPSLITSDWKQQQQQQQCGWNYEFKAQALYYHVYTYLDYYIQDKIYMSKYDMCYLPYCSDIGLLFLLLLGGGHK